MKSNIKIITVLLVLMTSCIIFPPQASSKGSNVSFQVFYDQLSPYGQWIDYSDYGYVWIPDAGADFVPYSTDGHWILTDYGWTWASDYDWGWATFHYGRWSYNDSFGWFWVPDNEWGPAWVNWRQAEGYYGWSPMEPGITVSMSFGSAYDSRDDHWLFVRDRDFERSDIHNYYINRSENNRIVRNSSVINRTYTDRNRNTTYVTGPSRVAVQKATGRTITPFAIQENNRPGQVISNGQLKIYRPQVEKDNNNGRKSVPTRVTNMNDVKRTPATNSSIQNKIGTPVNRTITQPIRTAEPGTNSSRPVRQRNLNQQDNQQIQQNRITAPVNTNSSIQRKQYPVSTPADNSKPVRKPEVIKPQNNDQPSQQNNSNLPVTRQNQQNSITTPSNQNHNYQPMQPPKSNPSDNNRQDRQQNVVTPRNNDAPPVQVQPVQPVQRRDVTPQNNIPQQPQNVNRQDNNNQNQRTSPPAIINSNPQPVQPQNVQPINRRPVKDKKSIKQQVRKEQAKTPDAVTDKK